MKNNEKTVTIEFVNFASVENLEFSGHDLIPSNTECAIVNADFYQKLIREILTDDQRKIVHELLNDSDSFAFRVNVI